MREGKKPFQRRPKTLNPFKDTLESDLLEEASALQPSHGLVLLLGTNDLIRCLVVE